MIKQIAFPFTRLTLLSRNFNIQKLKPKTPDEVQGTIEAEKQQALAVFEEMKQIHSLKEFETKIINSDTPSLLLCSARYILLYLIHIDGVRLAKILCLLLSKKFSCKKMRKNLIFIYSIWKMTTTCARFLKPKNHPV